MEQEEGKWQRSESIWHGREGAAHPFASALASARVSTLRTIGPSATAARARRSRLSDEVAHLPLAGERRTPSQTQGDLEAVQSWLRKDLGNSVTLTAGELEPSALQTIADGRSVQLWHDGIDYVQGEVATCEQGRQVTEESMDLGTSVASEDADGTGASAEPGSERVYYRTM